MPLIPLTLNHQGVKVVVMAEGDEPKKEEITEPQSLERFVRLKLTDEIVEVTKWTSNSLTIAMAMLFPEKQFRLLVPK